MHTHKCGFSLPLTDFMRGELSLPTKGCGYEWNHEELLEQPNVTDQMLQDAHMCPACKAGPWPWKVDSDTTAQHRFECAILGIEECVS